MTPTPSIEELMRMRAPRLLQERELERERAKVDAMTDEELRELAESKK